MYLFPESCKSCQRNQKYSPEWLSSSPSPEDGADGSGYTSSSSIYSGSSEKSPIFHQFLDCVYQIYRQNPTHEFNSRFQKTILSLLPCQYGSFLCDSEKELYEVYKVQHSTVSVWDYFNSRPAEFLNKLYTNDTIEDNDGVIFSILLILNGGLNYMEEVMKNEWVIHS